MFLREAKLEVVMNTVYFLKKSLIISLWTLIGLTSIIVGGKTVRADYVPPQEQEAPSDYTKSVAAGHRGDGNSIGNSERILTLLAPQTHVGQTISTSPTLAWFVADPEKVTLEFRLFEYDGQGRPTKLVKTIADIDQSSKIQKIDLSQYKEELKVNHKYLWQLTAYCDNSSVVSQTRADFKVVEKPIALEKSISESSSVSVDAYASIGFWYDALDQALEMSHSQGSKSELTSLIEQLIVVENKSSQEIGMILSECLRQILTVNF